MTCAALRQPIRTAPNARTTCATWVDRGRYASIDASDATRGGASPCGCWRTSTVPTRGSASAASGSSRARPRTGWPAIRPPTARRSSARWRRGRFAAWSPSKTTPVVGWSRVAPTKEVAKLGDLEPSPPERAASLLCMSVADDRRGRGNREGAARGGRRDGARGRLLRAARIPPPRGRSRRGRGLDRAAAALRGARLREGRRGRAAPHTYSLALSDVSPKASALSFEGATTRCG